MDVLSLAAGIVLVVLGLFGIYMLRKDPVKFSRLLKGLWGIKTGIAINIVLEIIVPIGLGILLIVMAINGISFLGE